MFSIATGISPENFRQIEQELLSYKNFYQTSSARPRLQHLGARFRHCVQTSNVQTPVAYQAATFLCLVFPMKIYINVLRNYRHQP